MRTAKKELREVVVRETVTCDRCGAVIPARSVMGGKIDEVKLERTTGSSYGGDGSGETQEADVCGACWVSVVVPALEAHGVKFRKLEWDT